MEIMVVVAIIGILATIVMLSLGAARQKARDSQRLQNLRTIGQALELYRVSSGHYPVASGWVTDCGQPGANNWIPDDTDYSWNLTYLPHVPRDPKQNCAVGSPQTYQYWSDGQTYKLTTQLEGGVPANGTSSPQGEGLSFDGFSFTPVSGGQIVAVFSSSANNPTAQSPIPFTITFTQAVIDFSQSSLGVVRGVISGISQISQWAWSFFVTPTDNDVITVSISPGAVHSQSGGSNTAAQYSITYNSLSPHLALSPDPLPAQVGGSFQVSLNSTVAMTDFSAASVSAGNATISNVVEESPMDGTNYTFMVVPVAPGPVSISVPANRVHSPAGQPNVASNTLTTTYSP
jgi:type II secretory pathway pseudopilin PulG